MMRSAIRRAVATSGKHSHRCLSLQYRNTSTASAIENSTPINEILPQTRPQTERYRAIRSAKSFSEFLTDSHNRQHDYLRISLTERCNLRCLYCMPEEGIELSPNRDILTNAEIFHLSSLFVSQGVNKIRLTGGEPTVRKDLLPLMHQIGSLRKDGLKELALTTNGLSLHRKLDEMVEAGLTGVNISLDTLDPFQYQLLTRRQGYNAVMKSIDRVKQMNSLGANIKLKINCVVMRGLNDHQILPFVEMTRHDDLEVRFIEYMPFGGNKWSQNKMMSYSDMLDMIQAKHPDFARLKDAKNDTSKTWQVPGFAGRVGFITSMTHNFCGTCNRLRITSDGNLKVCLHGNAEVSLRDMLRLANAGEPMDEAALNALNEIESNRSSMNNQLLNVIGAAVKRKKAEHAGMGELENMKNRPMILIDDCYDITKIRTASSRPSINHHNPTLPHVSPFLRAQSFSQIHARLHTTHSLGRNSTSQNGQQEISQSKRFTANSDAQNAERGLTHVDEHGAAHMVDVGQKNSTRRVAIATSRVVFTNSDPLRMIRDNTNRKGDVIGVARIAGIMAAKKTSDLIPLCHPLSISKVEVDPRLISASSVADHGAVSIQAQVECNGQTGVEMEALTAANIAALTIYDMCKAVDKSMVIESTKVVWKSGGISGVYCDQSWADGVELDFFDRRGLIRP